LALRILHLEDSERDAALIEDLLNESQIACVCTRVETEEAYRAALARREVDLVLADLSLPSFDGRTALEILSQTLPGIPFIFVSGAIGEEAAIESIKLGATDYVLKNRLSRLPIAVQRAVAESRERNDRRALEQQLLGVQRLEGFGLIAAGITHDLKNLLHPIKFASLLVQEQYPDKKLQELMNLIRDSADRGIDMVNQVMGLFRVSEKPPRRIDVPQLVHQLADLIAGAYPDITVSVELAPALPEVYGQPHEIHQALLNLVANARDAMKGKGDLRLAVAPVRLEENSFGDGDSPTPGAYLDFSVRDSGPGIPAELLPRIFGPLFTTKGSGTGTGLGLASVSTIVRNHRGHVRACNVPGGGAEFHLYFPADPAAAAPPAEEAPSIDRLPVGAGQAIGLVTEEAALRAAFKDVLITYGYEVRTAGNSAQALREFGGGAAPVDLLILDRELSLVEGIETARAFAARRRVPILLVTTDVSVALDDELRALGVRKVLHRPFDTAALLKGVAEVLGSAA